MATLIKRTYKAKLADGTVEVRKCRNWTIQYRDAAGRIRRVDGSPDKAVAKQRMAKLEQAILRGDAELVDPYRKHLARPLAEHVAEYLADLRTKGRDDKYVYNAGHRLARLAEGCGWLALRDVSADGFLRWRDRAGRPAAGGKPGSGRLAAAPAATTLNQYLESARGFMNWCARAGRVPSVPVGGKKVSTALSGVEKVRGPALRKRRALTDAEVAALLAVATGERALVYRVGLSIGLRRQELVDLVRGDLRLNAIGKNGPAPYVQLRAEATKARRGDRLDLPASLADALRAHLTAANGKDGDRVFAVVPGIRVWKADLAAAGIPYMDGMGRQADFHGGTRKTLCNRLHRAGVPLAVAMRRMRHTEAKLTMVDYADDDQLGADVATLAEIPAAVPAPVGSADVAGA